MLLKNTCVHCDAQLEVTATGDASPINQLYSIACSNLQCKSHQVKSHPITYQEFVDAGYQVDHSEDGPEYISGPTLEQTLESVLPMLKEFFNDFFTMRDKPTRESIAIKLMPALIEQGQDYQDAADHAVFYADALLKRLQIPAADNNDPLDDLINRMKQ